MQNSVFWDGQTEEEETTKDCLEIVTVMLQDRSLRMGCKFQNGT